MAYMNQEKKQRIVARIKAVTPKTWRVTFRVRDHAELICTISKADVDIMAAVSDAYRELARTRPSYDFSGAMKHIQALHKDAIELLPEPLRSTLKAMYDAMMSENYNRSDLMTDYHDVGYYAYLSIGAWHKPFEVVGMVGTASATVPTEAAISCGSAQTKNPVQSGDMIMTTITNDELRSLIARAIISIRDTINAIGGCDHDVNICCCDEKLLVEELQSALSKLAAAASEPTK